MRRALRLTNGLVDVRPVVLLAAKAFGPGSIRLEMVKLVHELNERRSELTAFEGRSEIHSNEHQPASQPECGEIRKDLEQAGGYEYTRWWEAFLIRVNDFDRLLEFTLRRILDPVVAAPVPARRGRASRRTRVIPNKKKTDRDRSANE